MSSVKVKWLNTFNKNEILLVYPMTLYTSDESVCSCFVPLHFVKLQCIPWYSLNTQILNTEFNKASINICWIELYLLGTSWTLGWRHYTLSLFGEGWNYIDSLDWKLPCSHIWTIWDFKCSQQMITSKSISYN